MIPVTKFSQNNAGYRIVFIAVRFYEVYVKVWFYPFLGIVWRQGSWTWTRLWARFFCKRLKSIFSLFLYPSLKFTNLEKEKKAIKSTDYVTPLNPMDRTYRRTGRTVPRSYRSKQKWSDYVRFRRDLYWIQLV